MEFQLEKGQGYHIDAYRAGEICINGCDYQQSLIVSPNQIIKDWFVSDPEQLKPALLAPLLELDAQIVLLSTGAHSYFYPIEIQAFFIEHGRQVEMMNTGAACRTYNVLSSEGRSVCAALII